MQIIWSKTGDRLGVQIDNRALFDYWFDGICNDNKNQFHIVDDITISQKIDTIASRLITSIQRVNRVLKKINIDEFDERKTVDLLTHSSTNQLHNHWTYLALEKKMGVFFSNYAVEELNDFIYINKGVHAIEDTSKAHYSCNQKNVLLPPPWSIENKFGPSIAKLGSWNVAIAYENLGKRYYDKWLNHDINFDVHDTNNYQTLSGTLQFDIGQPFTLEFPREYVEFCNQNNIEASGNIIPVGNFKENVDIVRKIFYNNTKIDNNYIQIIKD